MLAALGLAACGGGGSATAPSTGSVNTGGNAGGSSGQGTGGINGGSTTGTTNFILTSPVMIEGGAMPGEHSCDGHAGSPPLAWSGVPVGTKSLALVMTTIPADGVTKYNWLLYNLSANRQALEAATFGVADYGVGSDGPVPGYQPPAAKAAAPRFTPSPCMRCRPP